MTQWRPLSEDDANKLLLEEVRLRQERDVAVAIAVASNERAEGSFAAGSEKSIVLPLDSMEIDANNHNTGQKDLSVGVFSQHRLCDFESAGVRIVDLSVSPAMEVNNILAFGLEWRPIVPSKQPQQPVASVAAASFNNSQQNAAASGSSLLNSSSICESSTDTPLVQFVSIQRAPFAAATPVGMAHQQRIKQLPKALESNALALNTAEERGELQDIGVLYLERRRLLQELHRLQSSKCVGAEAVVAVHRTMQLPLGQVNIDGRRYYIHHNDHSKETIHRSSVDMQIFMENSSNAIGAVVLTPDSTILTAKHTPGLMRLFNGKVPKMKLLYSGKRHGMSAGDFHRLCDGKGPTLTVVRSSIGHILGGWAEQSWSSHAHPNDTISSNTWLFSFGSQCEQSHPVASKYEPNNATSRMRVHRYLGPSFGSEGEGLNIDPDGSRYSYSSAPLKDYSCVRDYEPAPLPLGGAIYWSVESIEVWSCAL